MAAFTWNGVNFRESTAGYASPEEAWGQDEQKIAAEWMTDWTDRQNARVALLGTPSLRSQATAPGAWLTPPATGTITETGVLTGGTWKITVTTSTGVPLTTAPIADTAVGPQIQAALEALLNVGAGNVTVTRVGGVITVTFAAALGPVTISIDNSALTGGGSYVASAGSIAWLSRTLPHPYPDPAANWLFARSVPTIKGWATPIGKNAGTSIMDYSDAKVACLYGSLPYAVLPDVQVRNPGLGIPVDESQLLRFVHRGAPVVKERALTYRAGSWQWINSIGPNGQLRSVDVAVHSVWCTTVMEYIWYAVPANAIPKRYILAVVGSVNLNPFDGAAVGTLLIKSPRWNYYYLPDGQWGADLHLLFEHHPKGWNSWPDPNRSHSFHPIGSVRGARVRTLYEFADIAPMFRPSLTG